LKGNLVAKNPKKDSVAVVGLRGNLAYQLKITLKDINPPIWRRIQVCGDITLYELHTITQLSHLALKVGLMRARASFIVASIISSTNCSDVE
jgi:hypothetical protein